MKRRDFSEDPLDFGSIAPQQVCLTPDAAGWVLAEYDWAPSGRATLVYERRLPNGSKERREVTRYQTAHAGPLW